MNLTEAMVGLLVGSIVIYAGSQLAQTSLNQKQSLSSTLAAQVQGDQFEKVMASYQRKAIAKSIAISDPNLSLEGNRVLSYCLGGFPKTPLPIDLELCPLTQNGACCPSGSEKAAQSFYLGDLSDPSVNSLLAGTQAGPTCPEQGKWCSINSNPILKSNDHPLFQDLQGAKCNPKDPQCKIKLYSSFWAECEGQTSFCKKPKRMFLRLLIEPIDASSKTITKVWEISPLIIQSGEIL